MMKGKQLTATNLRLMLSASLFLIVAIAATIVYMANTKLQEVATTVSHTVADASASEDNLQTLKLIKQKLEQNQDTISRVNSIVADSQSYQYQNQILFDLKQYASNSGVTITNFDFSGGGSEQAAPVPTTAAPTPATSAAPTGVKSTSVSITLANPVDYNSLLRFIKSIEQNLTKMQISKISLSKGAGTNEVTTGNFVIEVYIR